MGYKSRLITLDELVDYFSYKYFEEGTSRYYKITDNTPTWLQNSDYWTMTSSEDDNSYILTIDSSYYLHKTSVSSNKYGIRPVITLKRDAIYGEDKSTSDNVDVPNTLGKKALIIMFFGVIMILVGLVTYYVVRKITKERK